MLEKETQEETHVFAPTALPFVLSGLDMFWMSHLENMEALADAVRLRAYGQHDPLVEYRREGHQLFQQLLQDFGNWILENKERIEGSSQGITVNAQPKPVINIQAANDAHVHGKAGRNDPCPCGAKNEDGRPKKYKHCHGKNV
jgi:Preprotein translocase subunit SecA (ATPase, RNA helicase)